MKCLKLHRQVHLCIRHEERDRWRGNTKPLCCAVSSLLSSPHPSFHLFEGVFEKQTRVDAVRQEAGEKKESDLIQSN